MKWLLVTWYIAGGYPWTSYEFANEKSCLAAQKVFAQRGHLEYDGGRKEYLWYCIRK